MSDTPKRPWTPGPWRGFSTPDGTWVVDNWSPRNGNHDGLLVCTPGHGLFSPSNAHLIAAAPDLYEALERILAGYFVTSEGEEICQCGVEVLAGADCAFCAARAALAKARGGAR
jgi:hypothetical protein